MKFHTLTFKHKIVTGSLVTLPSYGQSSIRRSVLQVSDASSSHSNTFGHIDAFNDGHSNTVRSCGCLQLGHLQYQVNPFWHTNFIIPLYRYTHCAYTHVPVLVLTKHITLDSLYTYLTVHEFNFSK